MMNYNKILTRWVQFLLGALFIVSALLKINDPLGLQYKIDEYFDVFHVLSLKSFSFTMAVFMNVTEFALGVALLFGIYMKVLRWVLLGLLVFFTFLTGFAFFSGTLKECGCLGNCIPIPAKISFIKDVILLAMGGHIVWHYKKMITLFSPKRSGRLLVISGVIAYLFQVYVYLFLPVWDCMPFQVGTHIPSAIDYYMAHNQDSMVMRFVYQKEGQEVSFGMSDLSNVDSTYHFVRREDEIIPRKEEKGGIEDFTLLRLDDKTNISPWLLQQDSVYLALILEEEGWKSIERQLTSSNSRLLSYKGYYLVASDEARLKSLCVAYQIPLSRALLMDNVVLKTTARSPLTLYTLHRGKIKAKRGTLFYNSLY